mgnify:CR=1 FL=1
MTIGSSLILVYCFTTISFILGFLVGWYLHKFVITPKYTPTLDEAIAMHTLSMRDKIITK